MIEDARLRSGQSVHRLLGEDFVGYGILEGTFSQSMRILDLQVFAHSLTTDIAVLPGLVDTSDGNKFVSDVVEHLRREVEEWHCCRLHWWMFVVASCL